MIINRRIKKAREFLADHFGGGEMRSELMIGKRANCKTHCYRKTVLLAVFAFAAQFASQLLCTAQFAIRSPAFALPSSLFAHLLLHCEGPQDLLVSKAATGPSRVESSHRTFSCRKQPQDLLVSK